MEDKQTNWVEEMIERFQGIAEKIKKDIENGKDNKSIMKDIDVDIVKGVFLLILMGDIKVKNTDNLFSEQEERNTVRYKEWIKAVFKRDNYTCQRCEKVGGYLEAHHKKQFAYYPELRIDINNGETLCRVCHYKTKTYGTSRC